MEITFVLVVEEKYVGRTNHQKQKEKKAKKALLDLSVLCVAVEYKESVICVAMGYKENPLNVEYVILNFVPSMQIITNTVVDVMEQALWHRMIHQIFVLDVMDQDSKNNRKLVKLKETENGTRKK